MTISTETIILASIIAGMLLLYSSLTILKIVQMTRDKPMTPYISRKYCGYCNKEVSGFGEDGKGFKCPHCGKMIIN